MLWHCVFNSWTVFRQELDYKICVLTLMFFQITEKQFNVFLILRLVAFQWFSFTLYKTNTLSELPTLRQKKHICTFLFFYPSYVFRFVCVIVRFMYGCLYKQFNGVIGLETVIIHNSRNCKVHLHLYNTLSSLKIIYLVVCDWQAGPIYVCLSSSLFLLSFYYRMTGKVSDPETV